MNFLQDRYSTSEHLYFLPIGGTAMAPLACLLAEAGHRVEGVDAQLYPPMSTLLAELAIPVRLGFDAEAVPAADRVIIGNAVPRTNPEVAAVLSRRLPHLSQAEAVAHYLLGAGRRGLVVAGTHGKTTTSALLAWILERCGRDPSYLVGGLLQWSRRAHRLGAGDWAVLEGDEYNTAFFDRGPKFLHYRPEVFVLGPVELDHADLYRDLEAVLAAFRAGVAQVPRHGAVVVNGWSDDALRTARTTSGRVVVAGAGAGHDVRLVEHRPDSDGCRMVLEVFGRRLEGRSPLAGLHNAQNVAVALAAAVVVGVGADAALAAVADFPGVARRLEVVGEAAGVTVVDDFAHHPTALAATLAAARERWPGRRLVVAFEPRSLSAARREFEAGYAAALAAADLVLVVAPYHRDRLGPTDCLDRSSLASALAGRGVPSLMPEAGEDPAEVLAPRLANGDVVLGCSSGSFAGFHLELLRRLEGGRR